MTADGAPILGAITKPRCTHSRWADAQEYETGCWLIAVRVKSTEGDAHTVAEILAETEQSDWAALDELDATLLAYGHVRSGDWDHGSLAGYVAWIEPYAVQGRP